MRFDELVGGFLAYDGRFQENAQNNTFSGGILVLPGFVSFTGTGNAVNWVLID